MSTKIELYQRLRKHIPDEAARLIVEEMPSESELATREDLHNTEAALREDLHNTEAAFREAIHTTEAALREESHTVQMSVERLRSSMFRWQLVFFVPLWVGVYGTLVAIVFRGLN